MPGYYELNRNDGGQYSFVVKAGNGDIVLRSEPYPSRAAAEAGMTSVRSHCADEARYERLSAKDGRHYFNLKAANQQVIGTSPMYESADLRDTALVSAKMNGLSTRIRGEG